MFGLLYVNDFINDDVAVVSNNDNNKITCSYIMDLECFILNFHVSGHM